MTSCTVHGRVGMPLSLVTRIPPEIMARIFDFCAGVYVHGPRYRPSRRAPLLLGSVCRSWRALSLSMPRLWTALFLNLHIYLKWNMRGADRIEEMLHTWIQRSRPFPISLWLWNSFGEDRVPARFLYRLSHIIADNADRWRAIFVRFPASSEVWDCFDALVRCHMPALEELAISPYHTPWAPFQPKLLPRLRKLQITAEEMPMSYRTLPWGQLTHLTLCSGHRVADFKDLLHILTHAPLLVYLYVEITQYKCESDWDNSSAPMSMPHLITLVLVPISSHTKCINHLLDALVTPELRDFQLLTRVWDTSRMTTSWCHDSFLSLLTRSDCPLVHFTLVAVDISAAQLRQVLESCQLLRLLELRGPDVPYLIAPLLSDMTNVADQDVPLVPCLEHLSLSCESMEALDYRIDETGLTFEKAFTQLVTSRASEREPDEVLILTRISWQIWWTWGRHQSRTHTQTHPDPELEERLARLCADKVEKCVVSAARYNTSMFLPEEVY